MRSTHPCNKVLQAVHVGGKIHPGGGVGFLGVLPVAVCEDGDPDARDVRLEAVDHIGDHLTDLQGSGRRVGWDVTMY